MTRRAVFLDRDGTLIEDPGYVGRPERVQLLPGAVEGLAKMRRLGFALVVVSNQSGVARGYFGEEAVAAVHDAIEAKLGPAAKIDRFLFCPHLAEGIVPEYAVACECRKPKPGLILQAAREMGIDLARSFLVGDSERDLAAGRAAGVRTVLVMTGATAAAGGSGSASADHVAANLAQAADWIATCAEAPKENS
jgi:D-glycero-D-manno-heptose 1,7-bisphosphate phosphatase